ncbi:hypothetical protein SAMN05446635_5643 [Burkholderia sp. OK233]|nr:hypothetical protein SAMN05446635_5643 [Burkholderia sp. OK233]
MIHRDIAYGHLVQVLLGCSTSDSEVEICLFYSHCEPLPAHFRKFVDFSTALFHEEHLGQQPAANTARNKQRQRTTAA